MSREKRRLADWTAAFVCLALGGPMIYAGGVAFASGERRRQEAPIRAILGNRAYEALERGEPSPQHYLGNNLAAPSFSLPMQDGTTWRLSEHRGQVIVINMWTVTCAPCIEEMPSLIELAQLVRGRDDIELVTISVDRDWETVNSVVPADSPLAVLLDPDREVTGQLGTRQFPETWIIDREGVIRLRVDGARDWSNALAVDVLETYL